MRLSENTTRARVLLLPFIPILLAVSAGTDCPPPAEPGPNQPPHPTELALPEPRPDSSVSLEQTLLQRRSVRSYSDEPLTLDEVSQLLWAAQGITDPRGYRTAPSAGATYPLETYLVAGNVADVGPGVYRYDPEEHALVKVIDGDVRAGLASAALAQSSVREGAISIVFTAVYARTTQRYGDRGVRYVHMEAGHAAQNVYLQAVALNLGTVVIGAFHDDQVSSILDLPADEQPLYIMPLGRTG
ncbi:MAG: SagB/ThcOx family dehydrogenase [Dehalococcoidia bacterium]|nr:SagB/ThcOx family dehydrogenase [Dehalococcoidia bacterium]